MNIICLSDVTWNFLWQRQNQLMIRLPPESKVLYVEPSFWKAMALRLINHFSKIVVPEASHIKIVSIPTIPLFENTILRKLNDKLIVKRLRHLQRQYSFEDPILIFYNPRFLPIIGMLNENLVCYEIIDDKPEFEAIPKWLRKYHEELIRKADVITVSASYLYKKILSLRSHDVFLVGNGVDKAHFKKTTEDIPIPEEIRKMKPPILGYIGALGEWIDYELIEKTLGRFPQVQIVAIGWVFSNQKKTVDRLLAKYKNFHFLGRKSYYQLPNYMKAFTICIIPFRIYELTRSINPTKFYEYLATGKPIISTALPELEQYKNVIHLTNSHEQFLDAIQAALASLNDNSNERMFIAEQNDWSMKAQQFINIITRYLPRQGY